MFYFPIPSYLCYYLLPIFVKLHILQSRHPIVYLFVKFSFYFLLFNCLHLYLDPPILCMPNPDYDPSLHTNVPVELDSGSNNNARLNSPNPPPVNYETKPRLIRHHPPVELEGVAVESTFPNPGTTESPNSSSTDNPSTSRNLWGGELGVNYPNTSSILTQNNSVPSNINELGVNTPNAHSPQPANSQDSLVSLYSGADTFNTSLVSERGSITTDRFDANDYPNTWVGNPNTPPNNNHPDALDIGYLAPIVEESNRYDYTEQTIPKVGLLGELRLGFKSLNSKVEEVYIKYHDLTKRKFFWAVWEKDKDKYESYEEFKANWNPDTAVWKTIYKEIKVDVKEEFKGALGINKNNKGRGIGVSSEVEKMLRNKRPFNKK